MSSNYTTDEKVDENDESPSEDESSEESYDKEPSDDDILSEAQKRFALCESEFSETRKLAAEDRRFAAGDQWDPQVKQQREKEKRPCLTINRLPQHIHQVTNDLRQNRPAIKVSPVDDNADIDTAKDLQGIVRHIEVTSNADTAYDKGSDAAVRGGNGFFRVTAEFADPLSFDQDLVIKAVHDPDSCYLDPNYREPDGSDAEFGFAYEDISHEEFQRLYPKAKFSEAQDKSSFFGDKSGWINNETCRVVEYFCKHYEEVDIVSIRQPDGTLVTAKKEGMPKLPKDFELVDERKAAVPKIKWYKLGGATVLEKTDWLGSWIPIIPVHGEEIYVDGKRIFEGLVRHAKDPVRMYSYWVTAKTELIAMAPKAPYVGAVGQFEGHEDKWENANTRTQPYLEFNPISVDGTVLPAPQRQAFEPPVQAIQQAMMSAADDIKATTGIYDASLGNKSNENSGIAIQRRNVQAQTSNFHFADNLSKSIRHVGRILVELIPHYYAGRATRVLGEDGAEKIITLSAQANAGRYDVSVSTGPSFETKRQEAAALQTELAKSYPQLMQIAGDIIIGNLDIPGAKDISDRLKKTIDPKFLDQGQGPQQIPPQIQAQLQQQQQVIDQMTQHLNEKTEIVKQKILELESKERIAMKQAEVQLAIAKLKVNSDDSQFAFDKEMEHLERRLALLKESQPIEDETQESNLNAQQPGGQQAAAAPEQNQQQPNIPTGGPSPGQSMEQ